MSRRVGSPNALVTATTDAANSSGVSSPGTNYMAPSLTAALAFGVPSLRCIRTVGILPIAVVEILRSRFMPTEAEVIEALRPVEDPEIHRSIVDLDMVRGVTIDGARLQVTVALTVAGCPLRAEI